MSTYRVNVPNDRGKKYTTFKYPAGETQLRLNEAEIPKVEKADYVEVTFQPTDGETMELSLMATALAGLIRPQAGRKLLIPYLPYSRADRRFLDGDCFGLRAFGVMINAMGFDTVFTIDPHSPVAAETIRNLVEIPIDGYLKSVIRDLDIPAGKLLILLPDKGALRYAQLLKDMVQPFATADKTRDPKTGELTGFVAPYAVTLFKHILIIDDICDGGGTFNGLADAVLRRAGKKTNLSLYVTHGIFSKGTEELRKRFKNIYTTGSIKQSRPPLEGVTYVR